MRKMPALRAFIDANKFAYKSNPRVYIARAFLEAIGVGTLFIMMKSTEYSTNSAYYLLEGTKTIEPVLIGVTLFAVALMIFRVLDVFKMLLTNKLMLHVSHDFEYALNDTLSSIKWAYYENHETVVEIHKVQEKSLEHMKSFVEMMMQVVYYIVGGSVFLTLLAQINPFAVGVYLVMILVMNKAFESVYKQVKDAWNEMQPYKQKQNYFFQLSGDKVTHQEFKFNRLFGFVSGRWEELYQEEYKVQMKIFRKYEITFQTARFLINLPYIAMLIFVCYEIAIGKHEIGFLMLCNQLFNHVLDLFGDMQYTINETRTQYGFVESFFNLLKLEKEEVGEQDGSEQESIETFESIDFTDIHFTYPQAKTKSLKGVDLKIKAGEKIAIVGHNGSGKTTFTNLLLALTDAYEGQINLEKKGTVLQHLSSCILQDFAQYEMSVRENIALGYTDKVFTDEEIWSLLEKVNLKEMVEKLPKGIDTMLGQLEEGVDLSKGQWQRIAIARLLANPHAKIWVLDEPTAYLDPLSEIEIYNLIYELAGERVVLFISHRLGFAKRADRIVVFDDGIIKESGSHTKLLAQDGIYAEMYKTQEAWYVA
ncbi:MAG: ABC transporter ATP-binding protein [Cellulosilyticaceae bacterium]